MRLLGVEEGGGQRVREQEHAEDLSGALGLGRDRDKSAALARPGGGAISES